MFPVEYVPFVVITRKFQFLLLKIGNTLSVINV